MVGKKTLRGEDEIQGFNVFLDHEDWRKLNQLLITFVIVKKVLIDTKMHKFWSVSQSHRQRIHLLFLS